jgi:ABC-type antimicrobial peptide transport system permease subunit
MSVVVKSPQELAVTGPLKAALQRIVPGEPMGEPETMHQVVDRSLGHLRFPTILFSVFAVIALALAALGTFGVASQAVVQRRRELGIRLALGAGGRQVSRMVVRQALIPVGWGLLLGIGGAVASTRVLRGILFEIEPTDPVTLSLVALALAGAAVAASLLPARRAARTDPVEVLREE